jgi:hypothetical protein
MKKPWFENLIGERVGKPVDERPTDEKPIDEKSIRIYELLIV